MADDISNRPYTRLLRLSNQPFPISVQLCIVTGNEPYIINLHAANGVVVTQIFQTPDEIYSSILRYLQESTYTHFNICHLFTKGAMKLLPSYQRYQGCKPSPKFSPYLVAFLITISVFKPNLSIADHPIKTVT